MKERKFWFSGSFRVCGVMFDIGYSIDVFKEEGEGLWVFYS